MEKNKKTSSVIASNKKAFHEYIVEKKIEAGIQLKGSEVKSCRESRVQLKDSYAVIYKDEIFLHKCHISEYKQSGPFFNHKPERTRKLLLKKKEILQLKVQTEQKGYAILPLKFYFKKGKVKVELGLGKGKNTSDKRQAVKDKDSKREMARALKR